VIDLQGASDLLRGRIAHRPHPLQRPRQPGVRPRPEQLGEPEVGDLHPTAFAQEDVLGLEVPVDHALPVSVLESLAHLPHDPQHLLRRYPASPQPTPQVVPVHELHDEERSAVFPAELVDRDDAGMIEARQRPGLTAEAVGERRVRANACR
jgi:hypothetical protein